MTKLGVPSKVGVLVGRKEGDGNYGSYGREYWMEIDVPPDANMEETAFHRNERL